MANVAIILYDDDCGFCRWATERIVWWDRRGRLVARPIQGGDGDRLLRGVSPEARLASWHLATPDGRLYSGGAAVAPLARLLPFGAVIAALASRFPRTTERLYRLVARYRGRLGRALGAAACAVDPSRKR